MQISWSLCVPDCVLWRFMDLTLFSIEHAFCVLLVISAFDRFLAFYVFLESEDLYGEATEEA